MGSHTNSERAAGQIMTASDGRWLHVSLLDIKKKINETILVTVNDPLGVIIFFNLQL